jgi:aspartyl-tRNA(Asn)/glutamyl-tRNA(Gln) amidotransferase subunit A
MNNPTAVTSDPSLLPAHVLAREIAARRVSPVDVVDALINRIERQDTKLHAFVEVYANEARLAAEAAAKAIRSGHSIGPLHGIPVALKDLIDIEGRVTTGGSATRRHSRVTTTATLARRLIAQGVIVLGKTQTVEFAFGGWGTNQHQGTPWNPWDAEVARSPGGSSNGSGVAVAARMAPWAIGTDTGGSVRLPSAFCGLTGLKTTIGRISTHGILPLCPTLDTPGPMARNAIDAALIYQVLQGPDPLDPGTRGHEAADPMASLKRGVRGLRLGRMPEGERAGVAADVLAAYDESLLTLSGLGAEIVDTALPSPLVDYANIPLIQAEAYFHWGRVAEDATLRIDEAVRRRLKSGAGVSLHDYLSIQQERQGMKAAMESALAGVDALLTPTTATAAIPLLDIDEDVSPARFTRFVNMLEMCALAVPNGFTAAGLPTSLQIACRGYEEALALRIGHAWQQVTDWHERVPPMVT